MRGNSIDQPTLGRGDGWISNSGASVGYWLMAKPSRRVEYELDEFIDVPW
jgi:hypothetical protein